MYSKLFNLSTPQESFERSSAVFSGRVIDVVDQSRVNEQTPRGEDSNFLSGVKVRFEVSKIWKGKLEQQIVVTTSGSSASCGYSFQKGAEYLVYASAQEAKLQTGLCSGTKPLSQAQADLAVLGTGETPTAERSNAAQLQQNRRLWRNQNISSYRYTLRLGCNCLLEVTQPVVIEVRNGKVTSMVAANSGKPVNPEYFKNYNSIPKLFDVVQDAICASLRDATRTQQRFAIAKKAHSLSVTYHPTLGYPTQINIDYDQQMADEELYLTIDNLEVIRYIFSRVKRS